MDLQWNESPGGDEVRLRLTNIQLANAGTYQLLVTNSVGSASSLPLPVNVMNSAPFLSIQPASRTAYVGTHFGWSVPLSVVRGQ